MCVRISNRLVHPLHAHDGAAAEDDAWEAPGGKWVMALLRDFLT